MKQLFISSRAMLFKHISSGKIVETRNMFYAAYPSLYEFIGYASATRSKP